jgi:hypothetical protein
VQVRAGRLVNDHLGFSTTEVATVLTALTLLSGAAAPAVSDYVEDAKLVRARSDVATIAVSLVRLFSDVGAAQARKVAWGRHDLLVGAGDAPAAASAAATGWTADRTSDAIGHLDDHLVDNGAGYARRAPNATLGWRGAYLQQAVGPDPWGHRYAVNLAAMTSEQFDTVALSAGPDGRVDAPFERDGVRSGGDDLVAVVSSGTGR